MKITSFNPSIITTKFDETVALFEALGFERAHHQEEIDGKNIQSTRMRNADGFHVDVTYVENIPQDMTQIRMNVDDIEETVKILEEKGFKNTLGRIVDQGSSLNAQMMSPSGFFITVIHHVKK
jgi:adenylate cyclase class IV